ncbi:hypothetical protein ES703_51982 [subsurface metagenome]
MLDPETGIILFIVGGIGTVVSFSAFKVAQQIGPKITATDLLPMPPPHPPLPRFLYKPEVLAELKRR